MSRAHSRRGTGRAPTSDTDEPDEATLAMLRIVDEELENLDLDPDTIGIDTVKVGVEVTHKPIRLGKAQKLVRALKARGVKATTQAEGADEPGWAWVYFYTDPNAGNLYPNASVSNELLEAIWHVMVAEDHADQAGSHGGEFVALARDGGTLATLVVRRFPGLDVDVLRTTGAAGVILRESEPVLMMGGKAEREVILYDDAVALMEDWDYMSGGEEDDYESNPSRQYRRNDAPDEPHGRHVSWLYDAQISGKKVFVTAEPDGLFYVWIQDSLEGKPSWTYAYSTEKKALRQMEYTSGYSRRRDPEGRLVPRRTRRMRRNESSSRIDSKTLEIEPGLDLVQDDCGRPYYVIVDNALGLDESQIERALADKGFKVWCDGSSWTRKRDFSTVLVSETGYHENAPGERLVAVSYERYRGGAKYKRLYGGSTVTRFYVFRPEDENKPENWAKVEGYGPYPGNRRTDALAKGRAELIQRGIISA